MAFVGKNLKLSNLHSFRFLSNLGKNSRSSPIVRTYFMKYNESPKTKFLVTAAHKPVVSEDFRNNSESSYMNDKSKTDKLHEINDALSEIDLNVRRTGRTLRKNVEAVFSMLKNGRTASNSHALYLLRCCGRMIEEPSSKRIEMANEIWLELQKLGIQLDVSHYNALLKLYVENNYDFSPGEFLTSMSVPPDKMTYLYILEKYCSDGNLSGASEILEFIKEKGIPVNESVFNALIKCHVNNSDLEGAKHLLEVMRSLNISPTADSYTALACGYAKKGDMEGVKSCLQVLNSSVIISDEHILQIISALAVSGEQGHIEKVLGMMENISRYRQEFINAAIDLIHKDFDDIAYKLILASSDRQFNNGTNIFVRQLMKNHKPIQKVIEYCLDIHDKELNPYILLNSARAAIDCGTCEYAVEIFEAMHQKGIPIRDFYLWPLFSCFKEKKDAEGVWSLLRKMYQLGIPPDFVTYRDHILPALGIMNPKDILAKIEQNGLSVTAALDPLFQFYCSCGEVDYALNLTEMYSIQVDANFNLKQYLSLYKNFEKNSLSYLKVLKYILEHIGLSGQDILVIRGNCLAEFIMTSPAIFDIFTRNVGLHFNQKSLNVCRELLKKKAPELLRHFKKLDGSRIELGSFTMEEEKKYLSSLVAKGLPTKSFLAECLQYHIRNRNIDRVTEIKAALEDQGYIFSPTICAQMISLFSEANNLSVVENLVTHLKENHPTFVLDSAKATDYAILLIKFEKYNEALEALKDSYKSTFVDRNKQVLFRNIKRVLHAVSESGNIDFVKKVKDLLLDSKVNVSKEVILEPLIKSYVLRNDLESAVEEFKNSVMHHHIAPCLSMLLKKCIILEDQDKLEKVVDFTTLHVGKNITLHELAAAFVETGRPLQAQKVFQNMGNKVDDSFLEEICIRLYNQKKAAGLEQLISITRELKHVNREKFYYYLLCLYSEKNDFENVQTVWKLILEENIQLSTKTMQLLCKLFRKNNVPIPAELHDKNTLNTDKAFESNDSANKAKEKLIDFLNKEDSVSVLEEFSRMSKGYIRSLTISEMSQLISLLLKKKCLLGLAANVNVMSYVIENAPEIFKLLLEKYSDAGDIESLNVISNLLPDFALKKCFFNNYYCKAHLECGKPEDLLLQLEKHYDKKNKLFSIYAFQELLKIPEFEDRVVKLAKKYLESNFDLPIAVVWAHFFVNKNHEKADEIQKLHSPIAIEKVDSIVLRAVRQNENIEIAKKFINIINQMTLRPRTKERAYGTYLDMLVLKEMYDEAAILASEAEKHQFSLHKYYRSTLITLKSALERENKAVPFNIPPEEPESAFSSN